MSDSIFESGKSVPREFEQREPKIVRLSINDFAREIGLQPDAQGRFTFGPEHSRLAFEYAERFVRDHQAEGVVIDGVASPGVIASLLHGAHPAEGHLTYMQKTAEGEMSKGETKVLEPLPQGEGRGPEGFTWIKKETPNYTLVEFALAGNFQIEDLDKVIPPEVDPTKPVIISGRGPLYLTQTIAAAYRHYKGIPGVGFYQPASKFGPAKTEIGISHSDELPLGLDFGEPDEINIAKEEHKRRIASNINHLIEAIKGNQVISVTGDKNQLKFTLEGGETIIIAVSDARIAQENS